MRNVAASASSRPPPSASEEMAAIVGIGSDDSSLRVPRSAERNCAVSEGVKPARSWAVSEGRREE